MFLNCSTCFGRHTAHHQELKNGNCSLWFYIRFWLPKPEAAITVFVLLMMGGVWPETCWAIKKHWNNKFYYTVAFCWFFLWYSFHIITLWWAHYSPNYAYAFFWDLKLNVAIYVRHFNYFNLLSIWTGKGKAIPLQAWTGPEGSRRLRLPDFMTIDTWRW